MLSLSFIPLESTAIESHVSCRESFLSSCSFFLGLKAGFSDVGGFGVRLRISLFLRVLGL